MTSDAEPNDVSFDPKALSELIAEVIDRDLYAARGEMQVLEQQRRRLGRYLPANTIAILIGTILQTPVTNVIAAGAAGLGGGTAVAFYITCAHAARRLRRVEARLVAEERFDLAAIASVSRVQLLDMLPNARTRQAVAGLRALEYAARGGQADVVIGIGERLRGSLSGLSKRSRSRLDREIDAFADRVQTWPTALERFAGRAAIGLMSEMSDSFETGRRTVELGVELYQVSEEAAANVMDPTAEIGRLLGIDVPKDGGEVFMDWALREARIVMTGGFAAVMRAQGSERADALVRAFIAERKVPLAFLLKAYERALDRCDDPRTTMFGVLLADADPEKVAALALLGVERPAAGIDPPTLGR